jgi:hypothetical protein
MRSYISCLQLSDEAVYLPIIYSFHLGERTGAHAQASFLVDDMAGLSENAFRAALLRKHTQQMSVSLPKVQVLPRFEQTTWTLQNMLADRLLH